MGIFRRSSQPKEDEDALKAFPPSTRTWMERFEQYQREIVERPDYGRCPEVDAEMNKKPFVVRRVGTREELEADRKLAKSVLESSTFHFLRRCQERRRRINAEEVLRNNRPYRPEDTKLWRALPPVPNPNNGAPMPRMTIKSKARAQATFWDFFKHFQFGLWGYKQRPYPPEKPMDIQQVLGFKWLDKRYADFVMRSGGWYYKDRVGRTRGPMELVNLKTAWAAGIVDKHTFIWGDDMDEWAPISMVYGLESCVATPDMKLAAAGSDLVHKIARGLPLWAPRKGFEKKSYNQLQSEALEKKERENAVLRLNGGVWPGESAPSHRYFLWAGGSELTTILEESRKYMPDKFIPYHIRKKLAQEIPGLRPSEVLSIERLMDFVTYGNRWFRDDLGSFTKKPNYERRWADDFKERWDVLNDDIHEAFAKVDKEELRKKLRELKSKEK